VVLVVGPVIRCWKKGLLIVVCESAAAGVGFTIRYDTTIASTLARLPSVARRVAARSKGGTVGSNGAKMIPSLQH
jgi:hypothetical protein